ncbi:MAG: hypothetical protein ACRCYC_06305 [Paraclostridium sp.]|uniref:hypothetical protein n=1 Tax=Paraclostridium sp. TaxID=2023273 RepID=UPI003F380024
MTQNRFKKGQYENALQYTKDILSSSSSVNDIINKNNIKNESEKNLKLNINNKK